MAIRIRLAVMMAERGLSSNELAARVGISPVNFSKLKTGKVKALRLSTLEVLCKELACQPGDLLEYIPDLVDSPV